VKFAFYIIFIFTGVRGTCTAMSWEGSHINSILNCQSESYSDVHLLRITELASHTFSDLTNLRFLDLSANQLALIHPEALSIPDSPLQELNLSRALHNFTALTDLTTALRWGGLWGLLRLDLSGNNLALLPPGMFSYVPSLQQLLLSNNSLLAVADGLQELDRLGNTKILLGNNPYTCTCEIHEFVTWLNKSRAQVDVEAIRCSSPEDFDNSLLRGLTVQAVGCVAPVLPEVTNITLPTSYVFLGLVLGLNAKYNLVKCKKSQLIRCTPTYCQELCIIKPLCDIKCEFTLIMNKKNSLLSLLEVFFFNYGSTWTHVFLQVSLLF
uniref:Trophoblast glycoprotein 1a n=1 Tax=Oryzias melastigma TaxID=30732 RepID=A0A3B3DDH0_ORYME